MTVMAQPQTPRSTPRCAPHAAGAAARGGVTGFDQRGGDPRQNDRAWQPVTFLERGCAVPFTTPVLTGARARPAARYVELVVPHPAGARGVYIMAWSELGNFCAPTLHDVRLTERIAGLTAVGPRQIRAASRAVAAEGAAGRPAQEAARAAVEADRASVLAANVALLRRLIRQTGGVEGAPAEFQLQAGRALRAMAARLGRPAEQLADDIEALAGVFAPLGLADMTVPARLRQLAARVARTGEEMRALAARQDGTMALAAGLIASGADITLTLTRRVMVEAAARADDMAGLLAAWAADPHGTAAGLTRAEWLLDGWDQITATWRLAEDTGRRAAIADMALMVPVIPREADDWIGIKVDESERQRLRKLVLGFEDWRSGGLVMELIARNERARALAA